MSEDRARAGADLLAKADREEGGGQQREARRQRPDESGRACEAAPGAGPICASEGCRLGLGSCSGPHPRECLTHRGRGTVSWARLQCAVGCARRGFCAAVLEGTWTPQATRSEL